MTDSSNHGQGREGVDGPSKGIAVKDGRFTTVIGSKMDGATRVSPSPLKAKSPWLLLAVVALAQLMVVLDLTIMNIALPSAQRELQFTTADRQWVVTAYSLAFGSLLLLGGRLGDLLGRRTAFLVGLLGFAGVSAVGGASVNFTMLVTARACQGAFAALLVPTSLSILTTTFTDPKDRGKAFGVFGAIATAGGAVGLLVGGLLTEYLSWRFTLYVNLLFAGIALIGGLRLLSRQTTTAKTHLDIPGVSLASGGLFCLVYGFSNAATHSWHATSTWAFLAAGAVLLLAFASWVTRAPYPLLPPGVVLNRNRGGAYLSMFFASLSLFAILLFLTYYMQRTLGYSPVVTGLAFLPISVCLAGAANLSTIVLMPRVGPKPLAATGLLTAAGAMLWLSHLGAHSAYATGIIGPILVAGFGVGMTVAPSINAGTFGVAPEHAGVASATVSVGQQLGASIGTSLLNTIFAGAVASYLVTHASVAADTGRSSLSALALAHGYDTAFRVAAVIVAAGAVVVGLLMQRGPLARQLTSRGPDSPTGVARQAGARSDSTTRLP